MDLLHKRDFAASPYRSEREKLIAIKRWNVRKFFKLLGKEHRSVNFKSYDYKTVFNDFLIRYR